MFDNKTYYQTIGSLSLSLFCLEGSEIQEPKNIMDVWVEFARVVILNFNGEIWEKCSWKRREDNIKVEVRKTGWLKIIPK
jgi:hypothetical protein